MIMKRFVLIPDKFKGTMSSSDICAIMTKAIRKAYPDAQTTSIPVADGGEGSVDAFLEALGGERIRLLSTGPYGKPLEAFYGILPGNRAVIEMAACAGFALVGDDKRPEETSTYGVGALILDAARRGCRQIIMGLGGSSTNDAGCGCASACGARFLDKDGKDFVPVGGTLSLVRHIDLSGMDPILKGIAITTMCDIDNPFHGKNGAAYIFGPQKGADEKMVERLDEGLRSLSVVIKEDLGIDVGSIAGSGAAGGMGGGMVAFFGSKLQMGIETILDAVHFDNLMGNTDIVFTGEGKIDGQSLRGKVVIGVARKAKAHHVPVIAVVGDIADDTDGAYDEGVTAIFSINRLAIPYKEAKTRAKKDMEKTMDNLMHLFKSFSL
jgi:glycerate kinase